MDRIARFGLIAAVAAMVVLIPTRTTAETPPPVIEVLVSLAEMPPAVVNVSVPEHQPVINFPELPAPIVNIDIPEQQPPTVNVQVDGPKTQDRIVEVPVEVPVETIVEIEVPVETIVETVVEVERIVVCNPTDGRERNFAFIEDGLVTNIAGGSGSDFAAFLNAVADRGMEVTCVFPQPWIGWTFDGEVFAPPS